jgi:quinol monooxygenase YgiN
MFADTVTINRAADVLTVISVFTTTPDRQAALIDVLNTNADTWLRHLDGFIAAGIHRSLDGNTVVNYAQWRNAEALAAMLADPLARQHQAQVAELATVSPIRCSIDAIHRTSTGTGGTR